MEAQLNHEVQLIENIRDKLKVKTFSADDILKQFASSARDIGKSYVKYGVRSSKFTVFRLHVCSMAETID